MHNFRIAHENLQLDYVYKNRPKISELDFFLATGLDDRVYHISEHPVINIVSYKIDS
jgi:hypothetical protein